MRHFRSPRGGPDDYDVIYDGETVGCIHRMKAEVINMRSYAAKLTTAASITIVLAEIFFAN
jgi:hypothetical protein